MLAWCEDNHNASVLTEAGLRVQKDNLKQYYLFGVIMM